MKRSNNERGSVAVIVALLMVVLVGFSALVIDYGDMASHKRLLQNAVDAACLAAAASLPADTQAAEAAAAQYLDANAPGAVLMSVDYYNGNKKVTVTASLDVYYNFARVIVSDESRTITAKAAAVITNVLGPNDYALFSGSEIDLLQFTGQNYINGDVHANYNIKNIATVDGTVTAAGIIDGKITATQKVPYYHVLNMPDFSSVADMATALDASTLLSYGADFDGTTYTMSPSQLNTMLAAYPQETVFINGNLTICGSGVCATGCIIVSGDLEFNGSGVDMGAYDAVALCSLSGNITFNGGGGVFNGILFAGAGEIRFNGRSDVVCGSVIGDTIRGNGGLNIYYNEDSKNCIPNTKIMLVE